MSLIQSDGWPLNAGQFWQIILRDIYSGHAEAAWNLYHQIQAIYPKNTPVSAADFCSRLKTSPYYRDLDQPLKGAPLECVLVRPEPHR